MNTPQIKKALLFLSVEERKSLLLEIENETCSHFPILGQRRKLLDNKISNCPYCKSKKYRKHGIDKGSQRYYCNNCKRTFTEHTGTWLSGIHKKELLSNYPKYMTKIANKMLINKIC